MSGVVIRPHVLDAPAYGLLRACDLPTEDLHQAAGLVLYAAVQDGRLFGLVGLESHGDAALLRSLAVDHAARGQGLARRLVEAAEQAAAAAGVSTLYLLTTSAAAFFAARGYLEVARAEAPASIAATRQFSGLCPASSSFMCKRLGA